jgi:nitrate/nitrite transport system substrate-binding protein
LVRARGRNGRAASGACDAPEVNFGNIALTDCSSLVIVHEKGLFKKYGINSKVTTGANGTVSA